MMLFSFTYYYFFRLIIVYYSSSFTSSFSYFLFLFSSVSFLFTINYLCYGHVSIVVWFFFSFASFFFSYLFSSYYSSYSYSYSFFIFLCFYVLFLTIIILVICMYYYSRDFSYSSNVSLVEDTLTTCWSYTHIMQKATPTLFVGQSRRSPFD